MRSLTKGKIPGQTRSGVLLAGTSSDAHTWNLVFLQLFLEEHGRRVANLGPCVPEQLLVEEGLSRAPELIVLSSVNGHGYDDGLRAVRALRSTPALAHVPTVIGGKLGVAGPIPAERTEDLVRAGFDEVFGDGDLSAFSAYVSGPGLEMAS